MHLCLWCGYDLTGLPDHHACPECGLEYDPQATAIELAQSVHPVAITFFTVAFGLLFFALGLSGRTQWFHLFVLIIAGAFVFPRLGRMWLGTGRQDRLVLNRNGLNYCPSSGESRTIAWETLAEVRAETASAAFVALDEQGEQLLKLRAARFGGPKHVRPAIEEVLAARERYAGGQGGISTRSA